MVEDSALRPRRPPPPPAPPAPLRVLLVDNYDSYTYNLYQQLAAVSGALPTVIRNDEVPWEEVRGWLADGRFDSVVISPGPGTPAHAADIGVGLPLLQHAADVPVLGVCLGHQALALAHGGRVMHAPEPYHGRLSELVHEDEEGLFRGLPSGAGAGLEVVRYHSLLVEAATLPECLRPTAWVVEPPLAPGTEASPRLLMAMQHTSRPHYGVQFHPESIATAYGEALIRNFLSLARVHIEGRRAKLEAACALQEPPRVVPLPLLPVLFDAVPHSIRAEPIHPSDRSGAADSAAGPPGPGPASPVAISWRHLPGVLGPAGTAGVSEALFWGMYGGPRGRGEDSFWLDSASTEAARARFSFMGGRGGPLWRRVTYRLAAGNAPGGDAAAGSCLASGTLKVTDSAGCCTVERGLGVLDYLERELAARRCADADAAAALPFELWGGFVGYLGYEIKAECGPGGPGAGTGGGSGGGAASFGPGQAPVHRAATPDAAFFLADRVVALDHAKGDLYVVAVHQRGDAAAATASGAWLDDTAAQAAALAAAAVAAAAAAGPASGLPAAASTAAAADELGGFVLRRPREGYVRDIKACLAAIRDGETYEVCLTNSLERPHAPPARALYAALRRINPAPYGAWLNFGRGGDGRASAEPAGPNGGASDDDSDDDLTICSSSPERFLRLNRDGTLEAKPIKGTLPRYADPTADAAAALALRTSVKDRAENLMIVDLLRNDLGRVCQVGTVHVPTLMEVESYATVHQLVSTVRGARLPACSAAACVRAAFPGGSMTGAPKVRTMDLIDRLEPGARGVYSGALGFFSLHGALDLSIVIRTAVLHRGAARIGAGGAIVALSDPQAEVEEMRLKARALLRAVACADEAPES